MFLSNQEVIQSIRINQMRLRRNSQSACTCITELVLVVRSSAYSNLLAVVHLWFID